MHNAFCVFDHLLAPQLEEVIWIRIEFKTIFAIVSIAIQFVQWWWLVALLQIQKIQNKIYLYTFVTYVPYHTLTKYVAIIGAGIVAREKICWSNTVALLKAFFSWISCSDTSSTVLSSCVTLTANRSMRACNELDRSDRWPASRVNSPNRSSECLDSDDSCRMMLASVVFVTVSSSVGSWISSREYADRATNTGSIIRFGNGILMC